MWFLLQTCQSKPHLDQHEVSCKAVIMRVVTVAVNSKHQSDSRAGVPGVGGWGWKGVVSLSVCIPRSPWQQPGGQLTSHIAMCCWITAMVAFSFPLLSCFPPLPPSAFKQRKYTLLHFYSCQTLSYFMLFQMPNLHSVFDKLTTSQKRCVVISSRNISVSRIYLDMLGWVYFS